MKFNPVLYRWVRSPHQYKREDDWIVLCWAELWRNKHPESHLILILIQSRLLLKPISAKLITITITRGDFAIICTDPILLVVKFTVRLPDVFMNEIAIITFEFVKKKNTSGLNVSYLAQVA